MASDTDNYVDALKREREGYVARGLDNRVRQVDAELARVRRGLAKDTDTPETAAVQDVETVDVKPARGRKRV